MAKYHTFQLGNFYCTVLQDVDIPYPITELMPHVPSEVLQPLLDAHGMASEIRRCSNLLLVETGDQTVLIDAGEADKQLLDSLTAADYSPDDIDVLILTHADADHIGRIDAFSKAAIYMPTRMHRVWSVTPDMMVDELPRVLVGKSPSHVVKGIEASRRRWAEETFPTLKDRLQLVAAETLFLNSFTFIESSGHRSDHHAVEIKSNGETLLHMVDSIRFPFQLQRPDLTTLFDTYPALIKFTVPMLARRAVENNALVFAAHVPFPSLFHIERKDGQFVWKDI